MKFSTGLKALYELGPRTVGLYTLYQFGLRSGYYRWRTPVYKPSQTKKVDAIKGPDTSPLVFRSPIFPLPDKVKIQRLIGEHGLATLLVEADEVVNGQVRLFGSEPVPLHLELSAPLQHWTASGGKVRFRDEDDVKFTWERGRFGWAYTLGRAYFQSSDERYPNAFWNFTEDFLGANPPNLGLHWSSAQEVALRLMALAFALHIFRDSPATTNERIFLLMWAIAEHAARIPPTLVYARSLNNNHLISEAVGLLTAATMLPEHPAARKWESLGWCWMTRGIQGQIDQDGAYTQNSTNYHRLVLQLALWANLLMRGKGLEFSEGIQDKLAQSTRWLLKLADPGTGKVPNLGPNDGAYIFPLSVCPFDDYRPVLQAAGLAFLEESPFPPGPWDEMAEWFGVGREGNPKWLSSSHNKTYVYSSPHILHGKDSWAYLRVAKFSSRPGHADQLHLDIWWRGLNITQDAGAYLYNAPPPWDNSLSKTEVHNTLTVNGCDQMIRAGRFLWLDWAQGLVVSHEKCGEEDQDERLVASHDGFRQLGVLHQRSVARRRDDWIVEDVVKVDNHRREVLPISVRLHWLLPDWSWKIVGEDAGSARVLYLLSPHGWMSLCVGYRVGANEFPNSVEVDLVKAGESVFGSGKVSPTWGWVSPTYGVKNPALSFSVNVSGRSPLVLVSEFKFP